MTSVLNILKNVYDKVAGGINKILGIINITTKAWFEPFSAIYAGVVTVIEKVSNPAQALSEGAEKLKEAVGGFFENIKTKIKDILGSIREKVMILGKPAQLMKTIANKAVDMVLNFIITHPPSALIKALFKGIEAIAGKSIVELIRQNIPYADKIFDSIAGSEPVQSIMKPLEEPVNRVGGMIDQVTDGVTGMIDDAEKTTLFSIGSGAKLMQAMGIGGQGSAGGSGKGGNTAAGGKGAGQAQGAGGQAKGGKGDGKGGNKGGGGEFFETIRAQRSLEHLSDKQIIFYFKNRYSPRDDEGDVIQLHHHEQKEEGPIIEIPNRYHQLGNKKQHPLGNKGGVGANSEERTEFNIWRKEYWRARYAQEIVRRGLIK